VLERLARWGKAAEDAVLVLLLSAMIALAFGQIVLRNFFDSGVIWGDEALRLMVLWVALAGAVAASRADKHIAIDVLSRFLPPVGQRVARIITNSFTAAVCAVVAWHAMQFVMQAFEYEDELLGGLPAWWFQSVMPVAFALMSWRYFVFVVVDLFGSARPDPETVPPA
jgi:TRAP-type C4-dicarboxylate transport system permease small subunit